MNVVSLFHRLARHRGDAEHVILDRLVVGADDFDRERVLAGGQFVLAERSPVGETTSGSL